MNALEAISAAIEYLSESGRVPYRIIMHPLWTTRGYLYIVEYDKKNYIVINRNDFDAAVAWLIMTENGEDLSDYSYGVPVIEDSVEFQKIIGGFYRWTLQLGSDSQPQKTSYRPTHS